MSRIYRRHGLSARPSIPGEPASISSDALAQLRELKGFRHVMRHAYDLTLRADRLGELGEVARKIADAFPSWCMTFVLKVR